MFLSTQVLGDSSTTKRVGKVDKEDRLTEAMAKKILMKHKEAALAGADAGAEEEAKAGAGTGTEEAAKADADAGTEEEAKADT